MIKKIAPRREVFTQDLMYIRRDYVTRLAKNGENISAYFDYIWMGVANSLLKNPPVIGPIVASKIDSTRRGSLNSYLRNYLVNFLKIKKAGLSTFITEAPFNMGRIVGGLLIKSYIDRSSSFTGIYITYRDLVRLSNDANYSSNEKDKRMARAAYEAILICDFVAIDRFGSDGVVTDNMKQLSYEILDQRISNGLPTMVFTTLKFRGSENSIESIFPDLESLIEERYDIYKILEFSSSFDFSKAV